MKDIRYNLFVLAVLALTIAPSLVLGQNNTGTLLPFGTQDPYYALVPPLPPGVPSPNVYSTQRAGSWQPPSSSSNWINPNGFLFSPAPGGVYDYQTKFNLGISPVNHVNIEGQFAADDTGCLWVGVPIRCTTPTSGFIPYTHFVILASNFGAGINTVDFKVTNLLGFIPNYTGLDVEFFCPPSLGSTSNPTLGVYYDGPANASLDAWTINYGYAVSDTFTIAGGTGTPVTRFCFFAWVEPTTEHPTTVDWSMTSAEFGGTTYGAGTALLKCILYCKAGDPIGPGTGFPPPGPRACGNGYPANVYACMAPIGPVSLDAGTYWFNLNNATTSPAGGGLVFWDQNNGIGCPSGTGCPSLASENTVGTIPPESFILYTH